MAEEEAEIADDTRMEAVGLEAIIQEQYNAIQGTCVHIITSVQSNLAKGYITDLSPFTAANVFVRR